MIKNRYYIIIVVGYLVLVTGFVVCLNSSLWDMCLWLTRMLVFCETKSFRFFATLVTSFNTAFSLSGIPSVYRLSQAACFFNSFTSYVISQILNVVSHSYVSPPLVWSLCYFLLWLQYAFRYIFVQSSYIVIIVIL